MPSIFAAGRSSRTWPRSGTRWTGWPSGSARTGTRSRAAIVRIANDNMINALKLVSVNRGYDPRDFTLVAFGGAGGIHAVALAAELGINRIVVPRAADVFSAWGVLMTDLRRDFFLTRIVPMRGRRGAQRSRRCSTRSPRMPGVTSASRAIPAEDVQIARSGSMRYANQEHTRRGALPGREPRRGRGRGARAGISHQLRAVLHLSARRVGRAGRKRTSWPRSRWASSSRSPCRSTGRSVDEAARAVGGSTTPTDGVHPADIYDGDLLEAGMEFRARPSSRPAAPRSSSTPVTM